MIPNIFRNRNKSECIAGTFGKWPTYGGSSRNQQFVPPQSDVIINQNNIKNLNIKCTWNSGGGGHSGYITIDNENNGYIAGRSGNVTKFHLNNCTVIWTVNVAYLLGYTSRNARLTMRHATTLFINSKGYKGILFGTPNAGRNGISKFDGCWAIALYINNGTLMWKTNIGTEMENYNCRLMGFMIDENDHYAYGGMMANDARSNGMLVAVTRGKQIKLDINNGEIVHKWYAIDNKKFKFDQDTVNVSDPFIYRGISMWNMPAIIDNYLIFGTANSYKHPKYIENCLLGNYSSLPIENANPFDPCGNNRSLDNKFWRCLEKGVYPSSFIILNKNTFNVEDAIPLQGIDTHDELCRIYREPNNPQCSAVEGPDADLTAVAAYKNPNDGKFYGTASPKSGHFYVFEIPSGKVIIAKKIGPWSTGGGGQWSIAVDENNMIAIVTQTGGSGGAVESFQHYVTTLADGTELCDVTGSAHAINLNNGETIWQMANPWGTINNCNGPKYENYSDYAVNASCSTNIRSPSETVINVEIPPINETEKDEIISLLPGRLPAPVTIVNDMVFIATYSGDIFVHNLFNGTYIHTLKCPNRDEIKSGITVIEDKVVFLCGSIVVSMELT